MVLRDLTDRGIGRRDDLDHLAERDVGNFGTAEGRGHVDRPKAALRKSVEFGHRPDRSRSRIAASFSNEAASRFATAIASASSRMMWAARGGRGTCRHAGETVIPAL